MPPLPASAPKRRARAPRSPARKVSSSPCQTPKSPFHPATNSVGAYRKTRVAMQERGLDLLIVTDPSNMNWLTGYDGWSFYVHQCVVLGLDGEPIWYGRGQDANGALRTCFMDPANIIGYPDHYVQSTERHPMDYLSAQLADRKSGQGHHRCRDGQLLVHGGRLCLAPTATCPTHSLPMQPALVNWQRAVKSEAELALYASGRPDRGPYARTYL